MRTALGHEPRFLAQTHVQMGAGAAALALTSSRGAAAKMRDAKSARFYLPEESEPHGRTFMQWPATGRFSLI